jgi:hypothetical protein
MYSPRQRPIKTNLTVTENMNADVPLLEALFAVRREAYPRCELGIFKVSETSVLTRATRRDIPEDISLNIPGRLHDVFI